MSRNTDRTALVAKMADVVERGMADLAEALRANLDTLVADLDDNNLDARWSWTLLAAVLRDAEQVVNLWTRSGGSLGRALAMAQ